MGSRLCSCLLFLSVVAVQQVNPVLSQKYAKGDQISDWEQQAPVAPPSAVFAPGSSAVCAEQDSALHATKREWQHENLRRLNEENDWKNYLILAPIFPESWVKAMPRLLRSYVRNYIVANAIYFGVNLLWCYYIYFVYRWWCFGNEPIPNFWDILEQCKVASIALPLYVALPTITEAIVEAGFTKAYARIDDVGVPFYLAIFVLYMSTVEFCIYWIHRGLHDIKWAYKWLHHTHHKYNKEHTLSPFAGLAFTAADGILQASPYCLLLFFLPMHFLTHELLLFATAFWTTSIHDNIHLNVAPIMGAGYHTIHHTTYKHNYGQFFVFMDYLFGTLITPEEMAKDMAGSGAQVAST